MCDRCDELAEVVARGIRAPTWVCDWCGTEVKDMVECPECEGVADEREDGAIVCRDKECGHIEEPCNGSCGI